MKKVLAVTFFLFGVQAVAAQAGINVDINIGGPSPVAVITPPSLPPPRFVIAQTPRFIFSPALGFYISVGIPYDIVYVGQSYYLYNGGYWYSSPYYNGPWIVAGPHRLPLGLRNHRFEEIRRYRDFEFRNYQRDRAHYRGQWFTPEKRRKEERRAERRDEQRGENRGEFRDRH